MILPKKIFNTALMARNGPKGKDFFKSALAIIRNIKARTEARNIIKKVFIIPKTAPMATRYLISPPPMQFFFFITSQPYAMIINSIKSIPAPKRDCKRSNLTLKMAKTIPIPKRGKVKTSGIIPFSKSIKNIIMENDIKIIFSNKTKSNMELFALNAKTYKSAVVNSTKKYLMEILAPQ